MPSPYWLFSVRLDFHIAPSISKSLAVLKLPDNFLGFVDHCGVQSVSPGKVLLSGYSKDFCWPFMGVLALDWLLDQLALDMVVILMEYSVATYAEIISHGCFFQNEAVDMWMCLAFRVTVCDQQCAKSWGFRKKAIVPFCWFLLRCGRCLAHMMENSMAWACLISWFSWHWKVPYRATSFSFFEATGILKTLRMSKEDCRYCNMNVYIQGY